MGAIDHQIFAFDLLDRFDISVPAGAQMMDRILATMPVGDRSLRMTYANRYPEVDSAIRRLIEKSMPDRSALTVMDLGVSSAISSVALYHALESCEGLTVIASDRFTRMVIKRVGSWRVAFTDDGEWLQIVRGRLVLNRRALPDGSLRGNALLANMLAPGVVAAAWESPDERTVNLFHPQAVALAESEPRFKLAESDILDLPAENCDVARIMSVLFNWPDDIRVEALQSIARSLRDGGLLVVGVRAGVAAKLRCGIFRRCGRRMEHVATVANPAKEHEAILALELCPPTT